jgi:hypothetical protein
VLFATVCAIFLAGCGESKLGVVPVSGTLTIDGQPADKIEITLAPVDTALPVATGLVQAGSFELFSGIQGESGAVPGKYKVVLAVRQATTEEETRARYEAASKARSGGGGGSPNPQAATTELPFASKYTSSATSDKEVEITKGKNNLVIDVSSK